MSFSYALMIYSSYVFVNNNNKVHIKFVESDGYELHIFSECTYMKS